MPNRTELLSRLLAVRIARTPEDVWLCRHLRYLAYCEDRPHFDATSFPDRAEVDDDDSRAVHALLSFRPTGAPIGSVRLILGHAKLPVERASGVDLSSQAATFSRTGFAEISRLCMTKRYLGDLQRTGKILECKDLWPDAILGLLRGIILLSREHDVRVWCGMMSAAVLRGAARLGVRFRKAGPAIRLGSYGSKQPIMGAVSEVLAGMRERKPELWEWVTQDAASWAVLPGALMSGTLLSGSALKRSLHEARELDKRSSPAPLDVSSTRRAPRRVRSRENPSSLDPARDLSLLRGVA